MGHGQPGRQTLPQLAEKTCGSSSSPLHCPTRQPCQPSPSSAAESPYGGYARCRRRLNVEQRVSTRAVAQQSVATLVDSAAPNFPALAPGPPTYVKAPGRIIAIGDIHGDLQKTFTALALAGVLKEGPDREPVWCGGDTTVVQLGDVLDRGDREIGVIMLLRELDRQAKQQGGAVFMLNGNHESLNISGNYRYVTEGGMRESAIAAGLSGAAMYSKEQQTCARNQMYAPGRPVALELARNPTVLIVNNTLFAHGGVLPRHVTYGLERINAEVAAWMRGDRLPDGSHAQPPFLAMGGAESVMWNRDFGRELFQPYERFCVCSQLRSTLAMLGVKHLVVGHTPQMQGANCECNGQVWRVDVGMSGGVLNAVPQVLEIAQEKSGSTHVRLLKAKPAPAVFKDPALLLDGLAAVGSRGLGQLAH